VAAQNDERRQGIEEALSVVHYTGKRALYGIWRSRPN